MGREQLLVPTPDIIGLDCLLTNPERLNVVNSGIVKLQIIPDKNDGVLYVSEKGKQVPYLIPRFYFIDKLSAPEAIRGKHAHTQLKQVIFSMRGEFTLLLDDGKNQQSIRMNNPTAGIKLEGLLWHNMVDFTPDCLIYVIADEIYNEADYVRNYEEFLKLTK